MEKEIVFRGKLVASSIDWLDYTTYVFKNLESPEYIMAVRFPNWENNEILIGDEGYVKVRYVKEGHKYLKNGKEYCYKQTNIHFIDFIPIISKEISLILPDKKLKKVGRKKKLIYKK